MRSCVSQEPMTFALRFHRRFLKKRDWYIEQNTSLRDRILATLCCLERDPTDPVLRSHKVLDRKSRIVFSSRVTGELRILWDYRSGEVHIIDVLDLGGHSGSKKVYR